MQHTHQLIGFLIAVGVYLLIAWAGFSWARWRVNRRARALAETVEQNGGKILASRPASHIWNASEFDVELAGKKIRLIVRQWGRDSQLVSVHIDTPPLPGIWVRRERVMDRMSKSMGLNREVQLGDEAFDKAAFIASPAPDEVVKRVLQPMEVRALITSIMNRNYSFVCGPEGIRAMTLVYSLSGFDSTSIGPIIGLLEEIAPLLPRVARDEAIPLPRPGSPLGVVFIMLALVFVPMILLINGLRDFVHPTIDDGKIALSILLGATLWPIGVFIAARLLRNRLFVVFELLFIAIGLLATVPFLGSYTLLALNSHLDHGQPSLRRTHILGYYRHNSHTVMVESWRPGVLEQKIIIPGSIPHVGPGDTIDLITHPGAFGWPWVSDIRLVQSAQVQ